MFLQAPANRPENHNHQDCHSTVSRQGRISLFSGEMPGRKINMNDSTTPRYIVFFFSFLGGSFCFFFCPLYSTVLYAFSSFSSSRFLHFLPVWEFLLHFSRQKSGQGPHSIPRKPRTGLFFSWNCYLLSFSGEPLSVNKVGPDLAKVLGQDSCRAYPGCLRKTNGKSHNWYLFITNKKR